MGLAEDLAAQKLKMKKTKPPEERGVGGKIVSGGASSSPRGGGGPARNGGGQGGGQAGGGFNDELAAAMSRMRRKKPIQVTNKKTFDNEGEDTILLGISRLKKVKARRGSMGSHKRDQVDRMKVEQAAARQARRWKPPVVTAKIDPRFPVCAICGHNLKEDEDMIETVEGEFHPACFNCFQCKNPLVGDYLTLGQAIYHPLCLRCNTCDSSLGQQPLCVGANKKIYCALHSDRPLCDGCSTRIIEDSMLEQMGKKWHLDCFRCAGACGQSLAGKAFLKGKDGMPYCETDFGSFKQCGGCNLGIEGACYKIGKEPNIVYFHQPCYRCMKIGCGRELKGQPSFVVGSQVLCASCNK